MRFVKNEASFVNSSYGQVFNFGKQKEKTAKVNVHSTAMDDVTGKVGKRVSCRLCSKQHSLTECGLLKRKSVADSFSHAQSGRLCFNCLKQGHISKRCYQESIFNVSGCTRKHHALLHRDHGGNERGERQNAQRQTRNCATQVTTEKASSSPGICGGTTASSVYLNIVPVRVEANGKEFTTNAFLDEESSTTLCDEKFLELLGVPRERVSFTLTTVNKTSEHQKGFKASLSVAPLHENSYVRIPNVFSVNGLPIVCPPLPSTKP